MLPKHRSELTERHSLVGGEESHELRSLDGLNGARLVDIEVTPGLSEVSVEVGLESITLKALVGSEHLRGESSGGANVEGESTGGLAVVAIIIAVLTLLSIDGDDGSHEKIIGTGGESGGDNSLVAINLLARLPRLVDTVKEDVLLIFRLRVGVLLLSGGGFVKLHHGELVVSGSFSGGKAEKSEDSDSSHIYYYNLRSAPI